MVRSGEGWLGTKVRGIVLDDVEGLDIDTPFDLLLAEEVLRWRAEELAT